MLKLFTTHFAEKNITYLDHTRTASMIGIRLAISSTMFFIHAIFPFIKIPRYFNLEATSLYLFDKNVEIGD